MVWYFVLAVVIIVFAVLHIWAFPKLMLRSKFNGKAKDRGLKNINEVDGHTIIYAPDTKYRKYLKHYALSKRDGNLKLICDFDKKVEYADFDICLYDGFDNVSKVINIRQKVKNGVSEPIILPEDTAYVSIKLNGANSVTFSGDKVQGVTGKALTLFAVTCSLVELVVTFILKLGFSQLFGGIYTESFMTDTVGNLLTFGVGLAVIVICNLTTVLIIRAKNKKMVQRGRS